ncbi:MAG: hypothetical protein ACUBOA_03065 [Candidatus Loosdrechtia sp.]|uniref:hypothetical protein n=1 Tax=Candidatus Loosdrechtia sp. TaxID=3101272 RepID=UPI003A66B22F|nr:MAG: hypothetical protein QY305_10725 [Candidatus Jettenia sp. AMX2]
MLTLAAGSAISWSWGGIASGLAFAMTVAAEGDCFGKGPRNDRGVSLVEVFGFICRVL